MIILDLFYVVFRSGNHTKLDILDTRDFYSSVTVVVLLLTAVEPLLMRQRMLTQSRLQVATYTTLRPWGTRRKLTAWAGIQNMHEDWNVVTNFSL